MPMFNSKEDIEAFVKDIVGPAMKDAIDTQAATQAETMRQLMSAMKGAGVEQKEEKPGMNMARFIRAVAAGKGNIDLAEKFAKKHLGEEHAVSKALAATDFSAGGAFVPPDFVEDTIELLRPASVVRRMQPNILDMPRGSMTLPKLTGGATAAYIGENQNIDPSEQTTGDIKLTYKKLVALVPISNDFLRFSSAASDAMIRDDVVASIAQRSDLAFIRGTGLQDTPKGLRNLLHADNVIPANGTVNLDNVTIDLGKLVLALQNADVRMLRPGWLFSPRTAHYLMTVRDGNGNFAFREEMMGGTLWGYPYATTTQIPINLGGGTNESEVYFADFADVIIGDSENLMIDASSEAAYFDGATVQAAYSKDQTVIRAISEHDINVRHDKSIAVLTAVTWGA